ncbi:MAG: ABC transporter ATP-binding protein [Verrucomicrobiae bacterium]|nr:ABC transporter ATP-binding protein [Verrucomicrobiae bacterium]
MTLLETRRLSIGYFDRRKQNRIVAKSIQLDLKRGRFVCLLGPNGTGKSTLIRTLGGLQPPLAGAVELEGKALESFAPGDRARKISLVLTDIQPMGIFSVYSMVALGRHPHTRWTGSLTREDHLKIQWAITAAKADSLASRHISELSDGERQKVMIARALAQESPIMLLDEPTAFLDIVRRIELMHTLRDLTHRQSIATLLSTHDLELAMQCADELWLLSESGRITKGTPESLALNGQLGEVFGSDELDWDAHTGSFSFRQASCLNVKLTGEGPPCLWTRRMLRRLGYGEAGESETKAIMKITIDHNDNQPVWRVSCNEGQERFDSLDNFTNWLEGFSKTRNLKTAEKDL